MFASVCGCFDLRPRISFAIVCYHWFAPASAPQDLSGREGAAGEATFVVPALRDSISARSTAELRHQARVAMIKRRMDRFCRTYLSIQLHKGTGHPAKAGLTLDDRSKKKVQNRSSALQKIARGHPEAARKPQPERLYKARGGTMKKNNDQITTRLRIFE